MENNVLSPTEILLRHIVELDYIYNFYECVDSALEEFDISQELPKEEFISQCVVSLGGTLTIPQIIQEGILELELAYEKLDSKMFDKYKAVLESVIRQYLNEQAEKYLKKDFTIFICDNYILVTFRETFIKMKRSNQEEIILDAFHNFMTYLLTTMGHINSVDVRADYLEVYCLFNGVVVELDYDDLKRRD